MEPVDDPLLSAFIAGTVTPEQREHVLRHLLENADARDLAGMSVHALHAVQGEGGAVVARRRRPNGLVRVSLGALVLIGAGVSLRLASTSPTPATDTFRSGVVDVPLGLQVVGTTVSWAAVPGAARYDVLVWDATTATVTARATTTAPTSGDAFASVLRSARTGSQQVRVDAYDAENRLVASSALMSIPR